MALQDILSIRTGQCRYCVTEDTPFWFCGEPTAPGSKYCAPHHAICHAGQGRDIGLLESMIYGLEQSVVRRASDRNNTAPVDEVIRGGE